MSRVVARVIDENYVNQDGVVTVVTGAFDKLSWVRSDIVKTVEHKLKRTDPSIWLPPTAYSSTYVRSRVNGSASVRHPNTSQVWAGYIDWPGLPDYTLGEPDHTPLYDTAVFNVRDAIKGNKIQWGASLAESEQTISMIGSTALKLAGAARKMWHGDAAGAIKKLDLRPSKKLLKRVLRPRKHRSTRGILDKNRRRLADGWLELQFGWKPLLSDIDNGAQFLAERATRTPSAHRFRATGVGAAKYEPNKVLTVDSGNPAGYIESKQFTQGFVGYRITVWYEVVNRVAVEAAQSGLLDIAGTVWEIIPFSFVADWVVPVGKVLDSMTALAGKEFIAGTYSLWYKVDAQRTMYVKRSGTVAFDYEGVKTHMKYRKSQRVVLSDFPEVPYKDLLHVKNPLSVTHALDALALLGQSFKRFFH